ncbi:MAG: ClpXP protease specificity-enhancing factor SspB [Rickettsiales bacterium]
MTEDYIRYDQLIDNAMRQVVKEALVKITKTGLSGEHHFLISFFTNFEGVQIPEHLKKKYPEEMTIVLQHQYEDLEVKPDFFKVVLSFENHRELIVIPFAALTSFADPGVRFGLKFNILADEALLDEIEKEIDSNVIEPSKKKKPNNKEIQKKIDQSKNIVDLSKLRDKKK